MRTAREVRILYIGLHPGTLRIVDREPLRVVATQKLVFLTRFTFNPVDALFYAAYWLHEHKSALARPTYLIYRVLSPLSSSAYRRYDEFLHQLIRRKIAIIDIAREQDTLRFVKDNYIDLIVINIWSLISPKIAAAPRLRTVSIHPSKLPQYRGALPTLWALKNRDAVSAVTVLRIGPTVDGGDILAQHEFTIATADDAITIELEVDALLVKHLHADITAYVKGQTRGVPQSGQVSFTGKYEEYRKIDWQNERATDIVNKIGLYPYLEPLLYCFCVYWGRELRFFGAAVIDMPSTFGPGDFVVRDAMLIVRAADSGVAIRLFRDIGFCESFAFLLFIRRGTFSQ